ncbi:serine-rich adhesin for platelets isoform X3 [Vigna radiata var. radiata]|uniref:Serine-rich adhesin for platelets isoform X3 n=1 Tax=Vigna radiata var. radiata TaxID=3916 RepID=A0A3Q0F8I5_VIGRR|nr:serine-rich adhesin for platelets isoform X3 [Vigna radiata var. radiata]
MDEEFEKIEVEYAPLCEGQEIDIEYEFDAPQFFAFTRQETAWDASEAEQWFEYATSYPPSPFLLKARSGNSDSITEKEQVSDDEDNSTDTSSGKTKPLSKSSSSKGKGFSFMKPTASHLAKQKNVSEVRSPESIRFQRQNSSSTDCALTKRQKLEAGYLRKAARLKHQIRFTHKTKKVDQPAANSASKSNVTIAKEPNLVTALRAHRHTSKSSAESGGTTQSSSQESKARPLNKKILEGPAQTLSKTKTSRPTQCQEFHLRTSERAMQNTYNNVRSSLKCNSISNTESRNLIRTNSGTVGSVQEKRRSSNKLRGSSDVKQLSSKSERGVFRNIKVYPLEPNDQDSTNEPPTELFSKLTLASEMEQTAKSSSRKQTMSKGSKENRHGSFQDNERMKVVKEGMQRSCGKQYQRVNEMGSLISKQTCMLASRNNSKYNLLF